MCTYTVYLGKKTNTVRRRFSSYRRQQRTARFEVQPYEQGASKAGGEGRAGSLPPAIHDPTNNSGVHMHHHANIYSRFLERSNPSVCPEFSCEGYRESSMTDQGPIGFLVREARNFLTWVGVRRRRKFSMMRKKQILT